MLSFTKKEISLMKKLNTPAKVQDFLNKLKFNFERRGETLKSPIRTIREGNAHCMEGALLGAYLLSRLPHGAFKPLILHLKATKDDYDHVIAPFRQSGAWGALSKTNHGVLRFREPVYKTIRELVMSYFHEYFLGGGKRAGLKTLRGYSEPLNLNIFGKNWMLSEEDLWYIDKKLDKIKHYNIVPKKVIKKLRKADKVEIEMGEIVEYN
ncbi:hypothetical protein HZA26_01435 [Candidatus Nomurabacteria bacterium]|nr:hypothetical protein [Candidatus Nomurabacteria bacterium]